MTEPDEPLDAETALTYAKLHVALNEKAHVYFKGLPVLYPDCPGCLLIGKLASEVRQPVEQERDERIVAAAIKIGPVVHTGPHHATIIHQIVACGGATPVRGAQGFITSTGRFVDRGAGRKIAFAAGQVDTDADSMLSEELWLVPEAEARLADLEERGAKLAEGLTGILPGAEDCSCFGEDLCEVGKARLVTARAALDGWAKRTR